MKTNLFKRLPLAAAVVAAGFAGCTNEDILEKVQPGHEDNTESGAVALFSTGDDTPANAPGIGTKTTMDANGVFQWTAGDVIWVKNAQGQWIMSSNSAQGTTPRCTFVVPGSWTEESYPVIYVPSTSATAPTKVEIPYRQTSPATTDAIPIPPADYGYAVATRQSDGTYKFDLEHQLTYLLNTPRHTLQHRNLYMKQISASSNHPISGSYSMKDINSLSDALPLPTSERTVYDVITQIPSQDPTSYNFPQCHFPSTEEFEDGTYSYDDCRSYTTIKPGNHKLTYKYHFDVNNVPWVVTRDFPLTQFNAGQYFDVRHILYNEECKLDTAWCNADNRMVGVYKELYPAVQRVPNWYRTYWDANNSINAGYNAASLDSWNIGGVAQHLTRNMPNANELAWYLTHGDPHLDTIQIFTTSNVTLKVGGLWLKKRQNIPSFRDDIAPDGTDLRQTRSSLTVRLNTTRPRMTTTLYNKTVYTVDTVQYFFLPATVGHTPSPNSTFPPIEIPTYWSSTPMHTEDGRRGAYVLYFGREGAGLEVRPIDEASYTNFSTETIFK